MCGEFQELQNESSYYSSVVENYNRRENYNIGERGDVERGWI